MANNLSKLKLIECIDNLAQQFGLNIYDFKSYMENRLSTNDDDYIPVYPKTQDITITGDKTYVNNLKVMLAQNLYKDTKIIKINDKLSTLLKIPQPPVGWFVSEKFDGIRAIWDGSKFISRGSSASSPKVYTYVPQFFKELMPPGIALDGEIWIGRGQFKKTGRLSSLKPGSSYSKKQLDCLWRGTNNDDCVKYMVYDLPDNIQPFEKRMKFLEQIMNDRREFWDSEENIIECPLQMTKQTIIESHDQLYDIYNKLTSRGAEGVMLRAPNSPYEQKRSKYLLKYKIKEDSEALVREYVLGGGRLEGLLGSLRCEMILNGKPTGVMFNVGTGFTDIERTEYNVPTSKYFIPINAIVSFGYMELSDDGIPRHPTYRGIRDDFSLNPDIENGTSLVDNTIDYREKIISTFNTLIKNEETKKEPNWQFKKKAYNNTITALKNTTVEITTVNKAIEVLRNSGQKLPGEEGYYIKNHEYKSKSLQKIEEIIKTGRLLKEEEYLQDPKVKAITDLTRIPEIGPVLADKLYSKGINSIADLMEAYDKDKNILNSKQEIGLKYFSDLEKRIPRAEMEQWNEFFSNIFTETIKDIKPSPKNAKIELVGSFRRNATSSGDIDVLISSSNQQKTLMPTFIEKLLKTKMLDSDMVFSSGKTKFMGLGKINDTYRHIDIFYYSEKQYPFALLFSTGSGAFNIEMRSDAIKKGYTLSEKELKKGATAVSKDDYLSDISKEYPIDEKDIFAFLGLKYVSPENRNSGMISKIQL